MPILIFQFALVFIIIHAAFFAFQSARGAKPDWFEFAYQLAIAVAALWFLLKHT